MKVFRVIFFAVILPNGVLTGLCKCTSYVLQYNIVHVIVDGSVIGGAYVLHA